MYRFGTATVVREVPKDVTRCLRFVYWQDRTDNAPRVDVVVRACGRRALEAAVEDGYLEIDDGYVDLTKRGRRLAKEG